MAQWFDRLDKILCLNKLLDNQSRNDSGDEYNSQCRNSTVNTMNANSACSL